MRLFLLILLIPHMAKPKEVLNDWFALGSGCKAKSAWRREGGKSYGGP